MTARYDVLINADGIVCIARLDDGSPRPASLAVREGRLHKVFADGRWGPGGMLTPVAEARLTRESEVVVITVDAAATVLDSRMMVLAR